MEKMNFLNFWSNKKNRIILILFLMVIFLTVLKLSSSKETQNVYPGITPTLFPDTKIKPTITSAPDNQKIKLTITSTPSNQRIPTEAVVTPEEVNGRGDPNFYEKTRPQIIKDYPLFDYTPYKTDKYEVYYKDPLVLKVYLKQDTPEIRQEVLDWISSKEVDPSTHEILWRTQ